MSQFRRRLLMMMQKVQEVWRDVVLTGTGLVVANDTTAGQPVKIFPQGWTEQDSTTGDNKLSLDGFYTRNGEKIIPVNDALAFQTTYFIYTDLNLSVGSYYFTRKFGDSSLNALKGITIRDAESNVVSTDIAKVTTVDDYTFKIELFDASEPLYLYVNTETNIDTTLYDIGIFDTYPFSYEPYTGGQPSPSPEYPQPILNAGTYNEETGKYEYTLTVSDAEEKPTNTQSVTLTSDRPLTKWDRLVYMDGQWQWEYGGGEKILDGSIDEIYSPYTYRNGFSLNNSGLKYGLNQDGLCDKLITKNINDGEQGVIFGLNTTDIYFVFINEYAQTESEWREWLSSNNLTIQYPLSIPTYTPLSESEQQALNALVTYYPTTVFSNDQNGFMQIEYRTKYGGDA